MATWTSGGSWTSPIPSGVSSASSNGWQTELSLSSVGSRVRRASYTPSQRELRKYASLFLRTDTDGDGYIQGEEARLLGSLSNLQSSQLAVAWNLADQDSDGRLTFGEFVVFVHLITCCTRGLAIPDPADGRPQELQATLASLDTPANLHSQRSRSPSPAGSSALASSRATSPGFVHTEKVADPWEQTSQQTEASRLKVRPPHAPAAIDTSEDALNSESHHGVPPEPMSSPCFGGDNAENGSSAEADIEMIRNHLQGTVQADRVLTQRLQSNCKDLQAQLGTEEAAQAHIKTQAARAADDDRRLRDMAAELERQVTDARERLRQAHEDRRHLHSGQWAKQRSKDTSSFLHEQLEEEGRLLEEMQHSNKLLQESCRSLEQELKDFSAARVEVAAAQRPCTRFFVYCSSGLPGILCHASIADVGRII
mmetsp:Transcript_45447/g.98126  ORF Transcript_45447/g.98126 Transcript_45447/m.98126 type:complete len:425 (+) Transcript_45447:80-1354(+)